MGGLFIHPTHIYLHLVRPIIGRPKIPREQRHENRGEQRHENNSHQGFKNLARVHLEPPCVSRGVHRHRQQQSKHH